jgi:hypothetical protein
VLRADPLNFFYEGDEHNNQTARIVRLPYHDGPQHC